MSNDTHTIETTKGSHTDTLLGVVRWQCEMQGGRAVIVTPFGKEVDVDDIDFDAEEEDATMARVIAALAECDP